MINDKLFEKLKDAGFPKIQIYSIVDFYKWFPTEYYDLSLKNLIEACGKYFKSVEVFYKGGYLAVAYVQEFATSGVPKEAIGETIEEAVANLYIALNEKYG